MKNFLVSVMLLMAFQNTQAEEFYTPRVIWQQKSLYRNIIVADGENNRCLKFGRRSGRQSCIKKDEPNSLVLAYSMKMFEAVPKNAKRILVIGIGGGSLVMALNKSHPDAYIDAVELDPSVLKVARQFFNYKPNQNVASYIDDGRIFIRKQIANSIKYDAILIDAFDKDYIPEHMATIEFLQQVKASLAPGGAAIFNTFHGTAMHDHEIATHQFVFGTVYTTDLKNGNSVLSNVKAPNSTRLGASKATHFRDKFAPANALLIH